jgi:MerR family transcriptional regulator, redox-sensitive transcriptional activator SoxR
LADNDLIGISAVAEATGLQSSALRYYEKAGLIAPAGRAGGRRQYDPSVLQRLAAIALLQEAGFKIAEVRAVLAAGNDSWRTIAQQKLGELDAHISRIAHARELLVSAIECECSGLDTCGLIAERRGRHRKVVQRLPTTATRGAEPS